MHDASTTDIMLRPATLDDVEAVADLLNAATLADMGVRQFTVDDMHTEWTSAGFDPAADARLAVAADGSPVGMVQLMSTTPYVRELSWGRVHPDWRGGDTARQLWTWAERRARERIGRAPEGAEVALYAEFSSTDALTCAAVEALGMAVNRHFWRMLIALDAEPPAPLWPDGIRVRAIAPGEEKTVYRAMRAAFRDHWGFVDTPLDTAFDHWSHYVMSPEHFDPSLWFVALDPSAKPAEPGMALPDGAIAGMTVSRAWLPEDRDMGWVYDVGVLRPWRRKGIALALLLHTFRAMRARGIQRAGLGVDADSLTGAARLYEKAGMHVQYEFVTYKKVLREGRDLTTQA
jgi:mycothiol synthase